MRIDSFISVSLFNYNTIPTHICAGYYMYVMYTLNGKEYFRFAFNSVT